jgi:hypothetical protein
MSRLARGNDRFFPRSNGDALALERAANQASWLNKKCFDVGQR